jgi:hypothetical protein
MRRRVSNALSLEALEDRYCLSTAAPAAPLAAGADPAPGVVLQMIFIHQASHDDGGDLVSLDPNSGEASTIAVGGYIRVKKLTS